MSGTGGLDYEEALKEWGARKLMADGVEDIDLDTVSVEFDIDQGYACCGGRDEGCYCSMATSASCQVAIRALSTKGSGYWGMPNVHTTLQLEGLDFSELVRDIIAAGNEAQAVRSSGVRQQ